MNVNSACNKHTFIQLFLPLPPARDERKWDFENGIGTGRIFINFQKRKFISVLSNKKANNKKCVIIWKIVCAKIYYKNTKFVLV